MSRDLAMTSLPRVGSVGEEDGGGERARRRRETVHLTNCKNTYTRRLIAAAE